MDMRRYLAILACVLAPIALPRAAAAGDPPEVNQDVDAASDAIKTLFEEGSLAAQQGNWELCRAKLTEVWKELRYWKVGANLGACELNLGMHLKAAEHLAFAVRALDDSSEPGKRAELQMLLDAAAKQLVTLTIKTDPTDAEVLLDGKSLGRGPFPAPMYLSPDNHALTVQAQGRVPYETVIEGRPGLRHDAAQTLAPVPPPPPPPPPPPKQVPEAPAPRILPMVIGGGVAAVLIGTGVGLTVASHDESDAAYAIQRGLGPSACASPPQDAAACAELSDALSRKDTLLRGALTSFALGQVVALGTAAFAVWEVSRTRGGAKVQAAPQVGTNGGGLIVVGSW